MNDHPPDLNPTSSAHTGQGRRPDPGTASPGVRRLLTLTLVSAGLSLLSQLVSVFTFDTAGTADALQQQRGLSAAEAATLAEQFVGAQMLTGIVLIVVGLALYALVYVFLRKGRNWARMLGIVLTILSPVATFVVVFNTQALGGLTIVVTVLSVVFVVVNVLWLVTAFTAPVKGWFSDARRY